MQGQEEPGGRVSTLQSGRRESLQSADAVRLDRTLTEPSFPHLGPSLHLPGEDNVTGAAAGHKTRAAHPPTDPFALHH